MQQATQDVTAKRAQSNNPWQMTIDMHGLLHVLGGVVSGADIKFAFATKPNAQLEAIESQAAEAACRAMESAGVLGKMQGFCDYDYLTRQDYKRAGWAVQFLTELAEVANEIRAEARYMLNRTAEQRQCYADMERGDAQS